MACWFTIACCCWDKTACWASGGETQKIGWRDGKWCLMSFSLIFLFTLDTNQSLQVPPQQQEATSRLPQEGLSQLWLQKTQKTKHTHKQISVKFHTCLFYRTWSMRIVTSFQCEYVSMCLSVCLQYVFFYWPPGGGGGPVDCPCWCHPPPTPPAPFNLLDRLADDSTSCEDNTT